MLDYVQDADWSPNGDAMAVRAIRSGKQPLVVGVSLFGKVLFDSINWISNPKISPTKSGSPSPIMKIPEGVPWPLIGADGKEKGKETFFGFSSHGAIL